jgi:5-methylcytosine-specific restriction enzyme A
MPPPVLDPPEGEAPPGMTTSRTGTTTYLHARTRAIRKARADGVTHCPLCGVQLDYRTPLRPDSAETDHVVRAKDGGPDTADNLRVVCRDCNIGRETHRPAIDVPSAFPPSAEWLAPVGWWGGDSHPPFSSPPAGIADLHTQSGRGVRVDRLSRLCDLADDLQMALAEASVGVKAQLAAQYRATLAEIDGLVRARAKAGDPVDELAQRRAERGAGPAADTGRAGRSR